MAKRKIKDIHEMHLNEWLVVMSGLLSVVFALGAFLGVQYLAALLGVLSGGVSLALAMRHKHFDHTYLGVAGVIISLTAIWILSSNEMSFLMI